MSVQAGELERKIKLCEDVPGLAARLGQGGGMMEMVAGEINSDKPVRLHSGAFAFEEQLPGFDVRYIGIRCS